MSAPHLAPPGTLSFLFTDIEGSTRPWERFSVGMKDALQRHDAILRSAVGCSPCAPERVTRLDVPPREPSIDVAIEMMWQGPGTTILPELWLVTGDLMLDLPTEAGG